MSGPRLRFVRPEDRAATPPTQPGSATPALSGPQPGQRGLVLHASWVPPLGLADHALALWGEVESVAPARHGHAEERGTARVRPHPFTARQSELVSALERLWKIARPGIRPRSGSKPMRLPIWLPSMGTRPQPSPELVRAGWARDPALDGFDPAHAALTLWRVDALFLDPESAGTLLAGLPHHTSADLGIPGSETHVRGAVRLLLGSDLRLWSAAAKLVLDLLARQRYLPGVSEGVENPYSDFLGPSANLEGQWYASFSDPADRVRFDALTEAMPDLCRAAVNPSAIEPNTSAAPTARALMEDFAHVVVNARVMRWISQERLLLLPHGDATDPYGRYAGFPTGWGRGDIGSLTERWLTGLSAPDRPIYTTPVEATNLVDGIARWHGELTGVLAAPFRLCFRLVPPAGAPSEDAALTDDTRAPEDELPAPPRLLVEAALEAPAAAPATEPLLRVEATLEGSGPWQLQYWLQARDDPSLLVALADAWRPAPTAAPLDRRFEHPHEHALTGLNQAARLFEPIQRSLQGAEPLDCALTGPEAYTFLREAAPLLEEAGFAVQVPAWWRRVAPRPNVRLRLRGARKSASGLMGLDAVIAYDWKLALGDQEFTQEELERLVALKAPLVRVRGQWMELRPEQVDAALKFVRAHPSGRMSMGEALRASLTGQVSDARVTVDEVRADEWIGNLFARLRASETLAEVPPPATLHGTLRPYQVRGLGWLAFLARHGLGACLADDMGLGKCLLAGTRVSTASGTVAIESLWERPLSSVTPDGEGGEWGVLELPLLVHTLDAGEIKAVPARRIYRQRIAEPCVTVQLGDGSELSSTRRHRYLTPSGWKMAGELIPGDLVGVPARTPHVGTNNLSPAIAELIAWQMAEGVEHTAYHTGTFFNGDPAIIARFRRVAAQAGIALPEGRRTKNCWCVASGRLYSLFRPWGYEWGRKSATKLIPQAIFEAPLASQRAFITAMMDAEGHVGKTHCEFVSASRSIMYGMQDLLRHFGIWLRIRVAMKAATNGSGIKRPYYIGTFGGNSITRFANEFTLLTPHKQQALERLVAITRNSNVEGVPTQAVVAAMQSRRIALRSVGLRTVYTWQGMGRPLAASAATQLRARGHADLADQIDELASPGVYWCKVKTVTDIQHEGYVYDLEVPETHNYIANGVITHNTVQLLALMLHQKEAGTLSKPVLLVCPTSVVGNWRHETARFAPDLRLLVHHGAARIGRAAAASFAREVADYDLVVTTYSLLPRDAATLATADWGGVVLDEAQNIKNVDAKQSRIARDIRAPARIALTGTPVENRLAELWSIMDFLNPGYLGSQKRFQEHFAQPIEKERDRQATARLQAMVRPFVLRRLKTDPTVISDLPEKLEIREYCTLTREQVTLYEAVVRDGLRQVDEARGGMQRRATVLTLLTKLKQVCNHPAHFLGDGSELAGRSGKLTRLEELIEELLSEGDRALIFTQFTAMGDRLQPYLQERFGVEALYLHGSVPQPQRERLVARFQSEDGPPLFLLSLKAGGTGLNLTRATHVIHFDRWWNPAVENQATDRAFRIGQTRNVQVRKFVCSGTLEERIDAMIEQKRELAEAVIGAGEGWITEMSTDQLRDLFTLRADALGE